MEHNLLIDNNYQMQIKWNWKTTEWFQRASAYTGFHRKKKEENLHLLCGR